VASRTIRTDESFILFSSALWASKSSSLASARSLNGIRKVGRRQWKQRIAPRGEYFSQLRHETWWSLSVPSLHQSAVLAYWSSLVNVGRVDRITNPNDVPRVEDILAENHIIFSPVQDIAVADDLLYIDIESKFGAKPSPGYEPGVSVTETCEMIMQAAARPLSSWN
jgi:hypothetical protein